METKTVNLKQKVRHGVRMALSFTMHRELEELRPKLMESFDLQLNLVVLARRPAGVMLGERVRDQLR